jgi:hypothetical protein
MTLPDKQVAALRFVNCEFSNNSSNGLSLANAGDVMIMGGVVRNNGNAGIFYDALPNRGGSTICSVHFLASGYGAWIQGAHASRIMNCLIEDSTIVFESTNKCMFENNLLINSAFTDNGIDTVASHNVP